MQNAISNALKSKRIIPRDIQDSFKSFRSKMNHHIVHTPSLEFFERINMLKIEGRSTSFFTDSAFTELRSVIDEHLEENPRLFCCLKFDLINISTVKALFELVKLLNKYHVIGKQVKLEWVISDGDEDMLDTANNLRSYADFPFSILLCADFDDL